MTAPDRIWIDAWGGNWSPRSGGTQGIEYVRADLATPQSWDDVNGTKHLQFPRPTPLAEALAVPEVKALVDALEWIIALNDQAECCGKDYAECCNQPEYGLDRAQLVARNARAALRAIGEGRNG